MKKQIAALLTAISLLSAFSAQAFQTDARAVIVVDYSSGIVLIEKNADQRLPPASMSKLMTLYMVFEALADGRLDMSVRLPVSDHAVSYRGSSMFLNQRDRVSVEDLIRGVIVLSGNDACVVLAEALSPDGTEAGFAQLMNERARKLGMMDSNFTNSNGWPDPAHRMSARDLATISTRIIRDFPQFYPYFSETEFLHDNRVPENRRNRNPLLKLNIGADGLKTGYTQNSGYGLVGSAVRGNRRVIFVISGMNSPQARQEEAERMINWYFLQFSGNLLFKKGTAITDAPIWMGNARTVPATVAHDAVVPVPLAEERELEAFAVFDGAPEAPIQAGQVVGRLVVDIPGLETRAEFPLVAMEPVELGGIGIKILTAARILFRKAVLEPISLWQ